MTVIQKTQIVPYTQSQMFSLVDAIEDYPLFVPWCSNTEILLRDKDEVRAKVEFTKGGVCHAFSTINRLQQDKMIEMRLLEGPFRHLEGLWRFDEAGSGCLVTFDIEFVLSNRFLDMAVGPVLKGITSQFVSAFAERAKTVYGTPAEFDKPSESAKPEDL